MHKHFRFAVGREPHFGLGVTWFWVCLEIADVRNTEWGVCLHVPFFCVSLSRVWD